MVINCVLTLHAHKTEAFSPQGGNTLYRFIPNIYQSAAGVNRRTSRLGKWQALRRCDVVEIEAAD